MTGYTLIDGRFWRIVHANYTADDRRAIDGAIRRFEQTPSFIYGASTSERLRRDLERAYSTLAGSRILWRRYGSRL